MTKLRKTRGSLSTAETEEEGFFLTGLTAPSENDDVVAASVASVVVVVAGEEGDVSGQRERERERERERDGLDQVKRRVVQARSETFAELYVVEVGVGLLRQRTPQRHPPEQKKNENAPEHRNPLLERSGDPVLP